MDLICSRPSEPVDTSNTAFTMPLLRNSSNHLLSSDPVIHLSLRSAPSPLVGAPSKGKNPGSPFTLTPKVSHVMEERESGFEDMEDVDVNMIREIQRQQLMKKEEQIELDTPVNSPSQIISLDTSVSPLTSESNVVAEMNEGPAASPPVDIEITPEVHTPISIEAPSTSLHSDDQNLVKTNSSDVQSMNVPMNMYSSNVQPADTCPPDVNLADSRPSDSQPPVSSTDSLPTESPHSDMQQTQIKGVTTRRRRKVHAPAIARGDNSIFLSSSSSTTPLSLAGTNSGLTEPAKPLPKPFPLDSQIDKPIQLSRYSIGRINSL